MAIDVSTTLSDLVNADPRRTRVLEKVGLDYCCHGERPLGDAAGEAGLDVDEIAAALDIPDPAPVADNSGSAENAELAHDIVDVHHAYMWAQMPRMEALVEKVHQVHGERHPELAEIHQLFGECVAGLDPHMTREERVIFPAISRLEKTGTPVEGSLAQPLAQLRAEHEVVGEKFNRIRTLTGGYTVPNDACNAYRAMLAGLQEMEFDLHEHVHKENNVLFPHALELERQVGRRLVVHDA